MSEFRCDPGNCVKCCTDIDVIPVTLGDIYRAWFSRKKRGVGGSFYRTYATLCKDWTIAPSNQGTFYATPAAKVPCPSLDRQRSRCSVYDTSRYLACAAFPEDWVLELPPEAGMHSSGISEFTRTMPCFQDMTLTDQRRGEIVALRKLIDTEVYVSTQCLQSIVPASTIVRGRPSRRQKKQLEKDMRFISNNRGALLTLRQNLMAGKCLQRYEELVAREDPGFSFCEEI
ncbi:hypothetical protein ACFLQN_00900 [Candidatus Aenigmatarchaeota archaeon]